MNRRTAGLVSLYLIAVVIANLTVATFGPVFTPLVAFVLISFDLTARDALHEAWHRRGLWWKMAALIAAGSLLSYALNAGAGRIALASFVAFAAAGIADTLVYTALGDRSYLVKINGSNVVSAAVDSALFVGLAFGWLPWIVLGQWVAKVAGGALWAFILPVLHRRYRARMG
jgi:queuosine precursor transporter